MNDEVCLVTGGAGFIGSHVVDWLINHDYKVIVLDDLSGGFKENINTKAIFIKCSITDHKLLDDIFEKYNINYIFHLAAYAAEGLSHFIRRYNYTNNLIGSVNLINQAIKHDIKCIVFTSSIAVYGSNQVPMTEDLVPQPEDPYGVAKYAVEQDLKIAHEMFGMNYIIFRPHNVYGERQNIGDKYRNVIGIFMNNLLQGKSLTIFGDGMQTRAFSHIDDVAPIIASSIENKEAYNEVFNIGADTPYTVNELATIVMKHMNLKNKINHEPPRLEVEHAYSDHSKVRKYFKINKKPISLDKGIKQMVGWVNSHGSRKTKSFSNIELNRNLPESWK